MRKKSFDLASDRYYFKIDSGHQSVTIHRKEKDLAVQSYLSYVRSGKTCEWMGKWDGKKFSETSAPSDK